MRGLEDNIKILPGIDFEVVDRSCQRDARLWVHEVFTASRTAVISSRTAP
jgi:hypothetical protein